MDRRASSFAASSTVVPPLPALPNAFAGRRWVIDLSSAPLVPLSIRADAGMLIVIAQPSSSAAFQAGDLTRWRTISTGPAAVIFIEAATVPARFYRLK